ncbi:MAG: hypothetical protein WHX52_19580 [Anaerolineae bacterium]
MTINAQTLLQTAERRLQRLSLERLRVADDFLAYLEEREADEATRELFSIAGFEQTFEEAAKQVREGDLVSFERVRRNV